MEEVIWVEVLSRHRAVVARHRCTGRGIRIGRAYTNDVVLDDPYVAPEHAQIVRDEDGRLVVEDLGTVNGLCAAHGRKRLERLALCDDSIFRLGQTMLRIRALDHKVAPERQLGAEPRMLALIAGLFLAVFMGEALSLWLGDYSEPRAVTYVAPLVAGFVAIGLWSALWSLVSRVFAGHARFEQNLVIALSGALGVELLTALNALGAFGLAWSMLARYGNIEFLVVAALVCFFHLRQINPARSLAAGLVVGGLLAAASALALLTVSSIQGGGGQIYVRNVLPPSLRLAPVEDENAFFKGVVQLRTKLERDRTEAP